MKFILISFFFIAYWLLCGKGTKKEEQNKMFHSSFLLLFFNYISQPTLRR